MVMEQFPKPPYVVLYKDRVEICHEHQTRLTVTATSIPAALATYAKTYAELLRVTLIDRSKD